jgi:FkbM family methyltransferase
MTPEDVFVNYNDYYKLLEESNNRLRQNDTTVLKTKNGTNIVARHNIYDVKIIKEQFVDLQYFPDIYEEGFKPKVVLDIGGYIGDLTLYCASEFGAKVHCYEPTPQNFKMVKKNLKANPHLQEQITVINKGVSGTDQYIDLDVQDIHGEIHASSHKKYKSDVKTISVPCVSLDDAIQEVNELLIDLVKIDCEGQEFSILGETNLEELSKKIKYLVFEYHSFVDDYKNKIETLLANLEEHFVILKKSKKLCYLKSKQH